NDCRLKQAEDSLTLLLVNSSSPQYFHIPERTAYRKAGASMLAAFSLAVAALHRQPVLSPL
ncbi:hypothetical protein, partial [Pararcticibacter amylolyticus]|uniref:hypothetical protein n=1 Tax=Pararcticibacter amylolyticus TaxID=2173175 RepID=UPI001EE4D510